MPDTSVYIDGFNLYYGALKRTPYKWLDLEQLCRHALPDNDVTRIRYFTARVKGQLNPEGPARQNAYLRALGTLPLVSVHYGHFRIDEKDMRLANPPPGGPVTARVVVPEEKGSDVNLASYLLRDGFRGEYDIAVVVSNDSDLTEPIRLVKHELGLVTGILNPHAADRRSAELRKAGADFHRQIHPAALRAAQLPATVIDGRGRQIHKPRGW